jgi:hypothetical protein
MNNESKRTNDSFIRWQERSINELGKVINLLLSICLITIGFIVTKLLEQTFFAYNCYSKCLIIGGCLMLLLTIVLLLIIILNRLTSIRNTAHIARAREKNIIDNNIKKLRKEVKCKDQITWRLFISSIIIFSFGELSAIAGFAIQILKY